MASNVLGRSFEVTDITCAIECDESVARGFGYCKYTSPGCSRVANHLTLHNHRQIWLSEAFPRYISLRAASFPPLCCSLTKLFVETADQNLEALNKLANRQSYQRECRFSVTWNSPQHSTRVVISLRSRQCRPDVLSGGQNVRLRPLEEVIRNGFHICGHTSGSW